MAQTLDENLHIIEESGIDPRLLPLAADLGIISALDDEPNDVGGLTAAELKAKFDEAGLTIQKYINESLIPQVLGANATEADRAKAEAERKEAEALRADETEGIVARAGGEADRAKDEADRAHTAADRAEDATAHTPIVGDNGNWHVWNAAEKRYVDSGVSATGDIGPQGPPGVMIDVAPGMFAMGVNDAGHLILAVNEGDPTPPLSIDPATGHLIYNITTND